MRKRYIEIFVENKKVPNENFTLENPKGNELQIDVNQTIERIYEEGQGNKIKKTLKLGKFRNAPIEKVLQVFESVAFQFLLDDYDIEISQKIKYILEEAVRRKSHLFMEVKTVKGHADFYEILFNTKNEECPFTIRNNETLEKKNYNKKDFIEYLLFTYSDIIAIH